MPFEVTHARPDALDAAHHRLGIATEDSTRVLFRQVYETLTGAKGFVHVQIVADALEAGATPTDEPWRSLDEALLLITEGGSVELPDGSRITITPRESADLASEFASWPERPVTDREICAVWNSVYGIGAP